MVSAFVVSLYGYFAVAGWHKLVSAFDIELGGLVSFSIKWSPGRIPDFLFFIYISKTTILSVDLSKKGS